MTFRGGAGALLLVGWAWMQAPAAAAPVPLPPTCLAEPSAADESTPLPELRARVEALAETDPKETVRLLCATIPRVAREHGDDSVELAWWVGSLATPLIAYMDKHAEAVPLLDFAQSILEARLGSKAEPLADIHVAHAWTAFRQGRLTDSRDAWLRALGIREGFPGKKKVELQKVLVGLAHVQLALREFAGARDALRRARAILEESGDTVSEAAAAIENAFTNLAVREESYAEARTHAEAQIAIERQLSGGAPQLVPAYTLLGQVLERLDAFDEAEAALREAVRLAESEQGPLQRHALPALTQLGSLLRERGRPEDALRFGRKALQVGEETLGLAVPRLVRVLVSLAETHRALGELPDALHLYERSAAIVDAHRADVERQTLVAHHRGMGSLLLTLGEREEGRRALFAGLEAAGDDPTLSTERAAVVLALALSSRGIDDGQSRAELSEALHLFRARLPDSHPTILRTINDLCAIEIDASPEAAPDCEDARRRLEGGREIEPALRQAVEDNQSRLSRLRGDLAGAERHAVQALAAAAALPGPDPSFRAHLRLAGVVDARGDRATAIFLGKRAIAEIERLRGRFVGEDRRYDRGFLHDKTGVYRTVADWLMEAGRFEEGLAVLGLLKSEELYEFARTPSQGGVALTAGEEALSRRLAVALGREEDDRGREVAHLARLREAGRITPAERERLARLLAGQAPAEQTRAMRLGAFLAEAGAAGAAPARSTAIPRVDRLARDLRRFGPETAIAVYLLTDTHLRILIATRNGQSETRIPIDGPALRRDIGRFLDGIAGREEVRAGSRALYEVLARRPDEAAARAGAKRLVLWLDGALRYVPFAALHDGQRYLVDKYVLHAYPAAELPPGQQTSPEAWSVRGLGVTRAFAGYRPLPAVADELCSIVHGPMQGLPSSAARCSGALRGEGFADAAFTAARFVEPLTPVAGSAGPGFSILHLGTHFSLRPGNVLRSFLLLGDGDRLTLDRVGALDFTGIELLTLSACQTGLGGAVLEDGREVEGLPALVQRRGARRVVASLWQVEDQSTARLMGEMYRTLRSSRGDVAAALRRAQLVVRSHHPHPYYWAGFGVSAGP